MRRDAGSALILAILIIAILTAMGITLLFVTGSDVKMNQAGVRARRAFYISEAGIEKGRERLRTNNVASADKQSFNDELVAAAGSNGVLDVNPAALAAVYDAVGKPTGVTGGGDDVPLLAYASFGGGGFATYLTNDAVDGAANLVDSNNRVVVTSVGAGTSRSVEVSQAIVEQVHIPSPPATITMLGTVGSNGFDGGSSNAKSYDGDDCDGATGFTGDSSVHVPTVGTLDPTSEANAQAGADKGDFESGTDDGPSTVHDVSGTIDPLWTNCAYLKELATKVKSIATYKCEPTGPCTPPWATMTTSSVTFLDRDATLHDGKGLLWVTGSANTAGNISWQGTILIIGEGEFHRDGGGNGNTWGAVVVANIAGPNGVYGDSDDCTGGAGGFGDSVYEFSGGGNHDHVFCTDAVLRSQSSFPTTVVGFRQR